MCADIVLASRGFRRHKMFAFCIILMLAAGSGAIASISGVLDAILWRRLPVRSPEQLIRIVSRDSFGMRTSYESAFYYGLRRESQTLVQVFGQIDMPAALSLPAPAEQVRIHLVTPEFFNALDAVPLLGRVLNADDEADRPGAPPAVLSFAFWRRRLAGNANAVGREIVLHGHAFTIVGVLPEAFNGISTDTTPDVRVPLRCLPLLAIRPPKSKDRYGPMEMAARVRPGANLARARSETIAIWTRATEQSLRDLPVYREHPELLKEELAREDMRLEDLSRGVSILRERLRPALRLLIAVAVLLQLVICANVAGLLLARDAGRRSELATKVALGASRGNLLREMLGESLLLMVGGALGGLIVAWITSPLVYRFLPPLRDNLTNRLPLSIGLGLNWRVAAITCAVSAMTCPIFGLVPALSASTAKRGAGFARRYTLLGLQVAMCTALAAVACLAFRSFQHLRLDDPGFDAVHVVTVAAEPELAGYSVAQIPLLREKVMARMRELPAVELVASASRGVLRGSGYKTSVSAAGTPVLPRDAFATSTNHVSREYFRAMGMTLVQGREFGPGDETAKKPVPSVVNESFASRYFPAGEPVGQFFGRGNPAAADYQIVGVVRDAKYRSLREPMIPTFFTPPDRDDFVFCVRVLGPAEAFMEPLRRAVAAVDAGLPVAEVHTLNEEMDASAAPERLTSKLAATFAIFAVVLLAAGLYALIECMAAQNRKELGIRIAIGARPADILRVLAGRTAVITVAGIAGGIAILGASRQTIDEWVYRVPAMDPVSLGVAAAIVALISLVGMVVPAWRAMRIDPATELR